MSQDITEKNYRKLVLQVAPEGFSHCVVDTSGSKVLLVGETVFEQSGRTKAEDRYWDAFVRNTVLTRPYDEVQVLHDSDLNTFVPAALFDADYLGSYLQYNTKVFETDYFEFDELTKYEMNNVYIPWVNINNFLIDQFGPFTYRNANTVLVDKLMDLSRNSDERRMYAHFSAKRFEIIVVHNQKLLLFNSFEHRAKEDFIYYVLFTAEQLNLNPEHFSLRLLGDISRESEYFQIAYKYVRDVELADVSPLSARNGLSENQNRKHFILVQG